MADIGQVKEWLRLARDAHKGWCKAAEEDFRFYLGDQWDGSDRESLRKQKRPCLTINRQRPMVDMLIGWFIKNRFTLRTLPVEGGDESTSDAFTSIIRWITERADEGWKESRVGADGFICGRGYRMLTLDTSEDIRGEIGEAWIDPVTVIYDPASVEPTLADAEYVIRQSPMARSRIQQVYGDAAAALPEGKPADGFDFDSVYHKHDKYPQTRHIVTECWYKDYPLVWFAIDAATGEQIEGPGEEMARYIAYIAAQDGRRMDVRQSRVARVKLKTICGDVELAQGDSPFSERDYPIVPFFASLAGGEHQGLITLTKDVQRDYNKRRSERLHILTQLSHAGWWVEKDSLLDEQEFMDFHSTPGFVGVYRRGRMPPQQITTQMPPTDYIAECEISERDIRAAAAVNEDLLGIGASSEASGKAIFLRQQQGLTAHGQQMENFRCSKIQLGRVLVRTIQKHYTWEKVFRVLGEDGKNFEKVVINQQVPGQGILNNVNIGKYDVVVSEQPDSPTQRMINFITLTEFLRDASRMDPALIMTMLEMSPLVDKAKFRRAFEENVQRLAAMSGGGTPPPTMPANAAAAGGSAPPGRGA